MIPEDLIVLIEGDSYSHYQPIRGREGSAQRHRMYEDVFKGIDSILDVREKRILEPGPLYGYYTFGLCYRGAREVVAVEIDETKYKICQGLKEYYQIQEATFINEDFLMYKYWEEDFDIFFCMNILHHFLGRQNYLTKRFLKRLSAQIPEMIMVMGIRLGDRVFGDPHVLIPSFILSHTSYRYAKKIGEWSGRYVFYFT